MKKSEKEVIQEIFSSVNPYLNTPSDLEDVIEETVEESENLEDFERKFEELASKQEDPSFKADFRIFLNKLRSR